MLYLIITHVSYLIMMVINVCDQKTLQLKSVRMICCTPSCFQKPKSLWRSGDVECYTEKKGNESTWNAFVYI